jgi:excinuclease ABC subunit C
VVRRPSDLQNVKIPACLTLDPHGLSLPEQIAALPGRSGVYLLAGVPRAPGSAHLHLGWSANLPRRLSRLLVSPAAMPPSPVVRVRQQLARIECWATGSKLEAALLMYQLAKLHFPDAYVKRLRLRMPWFVGVGHSDPFPRVLVTNRASHKTGRFFGPFPSRDIAQQYEQELLGLFQVRRCVERLTPHPEHPGCIYGEINQCLRPCQCAVTEEEYTSEVTRVAEFLSTNGRSALSTLSAARDRACEEADFEQAAHIHKRIEKVNAAAAARDEAITEIQHFNGLALTAALQPRQFRLWPMFGGLWQEPITLTFAADEARTKSLDQELREQITESLANVNTVGNRIEDLAIFSRWYFSSWRDGHWYRFRTLADLHYRRLVRQISKMAQPPPANPA